MIRRSLLLSTALATLAACQAKPPALAPLPPLANDTGTANPRVNGTVAEAPGAGPGPSVVAGSGTGITTSRAPAAAASGDVTLDFADTDIREIAKQVLGGILKVNYTIDPAVHGTATVETNKPIPKAELLPTLETLLNQNGATIVQTGSLYRVVPSAVAIASPSLGSESSAGSQVVELHYASAAELAKVLTPYVGEGAKIAPDPAHNALVISGDPGARQAVQSLIRAFDIDVLAGQSYALFPVTSGDPGKVATELQKVFQTEGDGSLAGVVRVVPMERVNAVLLISSQPRYIDDAKRLFSLVEAGRLETARSWHVYYVQNGQSGDIANTLQRAFTPDNVTAQPEASGSTSPGAGSSSSGSGSSSGGIFGSSSGLGSSGGGSGLGSSSSGGLGSSGLGSSSGSGTGFGSSTSGSLPHPPSSDQGSSPATDSLSSGGNDKGDTNAIRIIANKTNNAILIFATPEEELTIESMLHKIDILPLQVRIDATIAEVTLNDNLQYGTQFTFKGGGIDGLLSNAANGTISNLAGSTPGFNLVRTGAAGNAQLVLSALASITNVRVLSSPQVLVLDNQPARLLVGSLVPYESGSTSTLTNTAEVFNTINYQETGIILEVVPRVNNGGLVTLDVSQEVSEPQTTATTSGIDSPTFTERKVQSRISVQDGQTIGLAGLITDNSSQGNSGIPFLKDVPVLGSFFSTQTNTRERTELIVLITPHVIQDQRDARALTEDLRENLLNAGLVPQQLNNLPAQGSNNPNAKLSR